MNRSLEIRKEVAADYPDDTGAQVELALAFRNIASRNQRRHEYDLAIENYNQGLAILQTRQKQGKLPAQSEAQIEIVKAAIQQCEFEKMQLK